MVFPFRVCRGYLYGWGIQFVILCEDLQQAIVARLFYRGFKHREFRGIKRDPKEKDASCKDDNIGDYPQVKF
jgi:hypothetical protein